MQIKQILKPAAVLTAALLLSGTVFAAPLPGILTATASEADRGSAAAADSTAAGGTAGSAAAETGVEGDVFLSPDFRWSEDMPGEFLVRFTITNRSNMVIPETEVRITLPENSEKHLRFSGEPEFTGAAPANGELTASGDRELRMRLADFQVGEAFKVAAGGRMREDTEERPEPAGNMHVSLVLRGYGEEHATALDYRIPDPVPESREQEETGETEPQVLMMLAAVLTGTGRGSVTSEIVDGPLDRSVLFISKAGESVKRALRFPAGKEEKRQAEYPLTMMKLLPVPAVLVTLFALYVLYCIQNVRRRAAAFRFDPLMKPRGKR